jgi:hypothetical protein
MGLPSADPPVSVVDRVRWRMTRLAARRTDKATNTEPSDTTPVELAGGVGGRVGAALVAVTVGLRTTVVGAAEVGDRETDGEVDDGVVTDVVVGGDVVVTVVDVASAGVGDSATRRPIPNPPAPTPGPAPTDQPRGASTGAASRRTHIQRFANHLMNS